MTLTENQRIRVIQSIKETESILAKEMKYSEDLRNHDKVDFYNKHIEKLKNMLA